jgi:large subunit ribosomal protein L12
MTHMEYIYSAMVLYSAGKEITEHSVTAVLAAAGVSVDAAKVKALIASLDGVNIKEAIANASVAAAPAAAAPAAAVHAAAPAAVEEPEEEAVSEEEAAAGLSALFG